MTSTKICQICGDINAKISYDVLCCSSCKIFFRRNIETKLVNKIYLY